MDDRIIDSWDIEGILIPEHIDKKRKAGKLKPAQQRHNQKQAKVWATKVARRGVK